MVRRENALPRRIKRCKLSQNSRWRRNPFDANTVNSVLITEEEHIIEFHEEPNAYGFYANEGILFDANDPVVLVQDNTAQTAFTEIPRTIAPSSGQYRVDYDEDGYYNTGFVQCNSSDNGKTVLFTYRGTGTLVHPTFRTLTDYNYAGNVNVEGNGQIDGSLTVGGAITFNGALNVAGSVSLAENTGSTISANGKKIEDVSDGTANTDAATFGQLENFRLSVAYLFGWVESTQPLNRDYSGVSTNGTGVWVSVSSPNVGTNAVARSTDDGVSWATVSVPENTNNWTHVRYGNGVFVAVASSGTNRVMRSTDNGASWSAVAAAEANSWAEVATNGAGVWVAVAIDGTNRVMRSTDNGASWSAVAAAEANEWRSVTYGNGVFVAVASSGTNRVMRSTDNGASWSAVAASEASAWVSVRYGNGVFVAVASSGTNRVMRSTDNGASWASQSAPAVAYNCAAYGNGNFLAQSGAQMYRSFDDGQSWAAANLPSSVTLNDIDYADGVFVGVSGVDTYKILRNPGL